MDLNSHICIIVNNHSYYNHLKTEVQVFKFLTSQTWRSLWTVWIMYFPETKPPVKTIHGIRAHRYMHFPKTKPPALLFFQTPFISIFQSNMHTCLQNLITTLFSKFDHKSIFQSDCNHVFPIQLQFCFLNMYLDLLLSVPTYPPSKPSSTSPSAHIKNHHQPCSPA